MDMIESYQQTCYETYGLHFIHASDEFYILAGREFPEEERYDGYIQLENGVGMMRLLMEEFSQAFHASINNKCYHKNRDTFKRSLTVATGQLACSTLEAFAAQLMEAWPGLKIKVCAIRNDFFGETITVSGLITGQDLITQLRQRQETGEDLGETLLIPANMLRSGEQVFLDDVTVSDVESALGLRVVPVESGGQDFVDAVLDETYCMKRENDQFVYVQGYDR